LNTYLYIMELIFIKILGFFCDNEMLHKHTNGHGEIFFQNCDLNHMEQGLPACFFALNFDTAFSELPVLYCIW